MLSLWLAEPWVGELLSWAPSTLGATSVLALDSMAKAHLPPERKSGFQDYLAQGLMSDTMLVASGKGLKVGAGWLWMSVSG